VSEGAMTQEESEHSPMHNVILQALGTTNQIKPLIGTKGIPLKLGDIWILCSDGIYNMVPNGTIADIAGRLAPQEACDALIEAALAAGGHDNASLGIFSVTAGVESQVAPQTKTRRMQIPIESDRER
jgi:protein phosphatase